NPSAPKGLQGLLTPADSGKKSDTGRVAKGKTDTTRADSLLTGGGALSNLIQQGALPGEYYVEARSVATVERYLADSVVRATLPPAREILWGTDSSTI